MLSQPQWSDLLSDNISTQTSCSISTAEEDICIYRSPGAPLGLGLRFSGGARAGDPVRALFVQNCAPGSKAASVRCSWGTGLCEGDRVLAIGGRRVDGRLTRIECVKALKGTGVTTPRVVMRHVNKCNLSCCRISNFGQNANQALFRVVCADGGCLRQRARR